MVAPDPNRNDTNWDVILNARLDDLQSQITTNGTNVTSNTTRISALEGNNAWRPSDHNLLTWAYDPAMVTNGTTSTTTSGTVYLVKVNLRNGGTVTNVIATVGTAGATLTASQNFAGIYDTLGNRLGVTADQSSSWTSTGTKTMAISGGPLVLAAGSYYVALLSNGTTPPKFQCTFSTAATPSLNNVGLTAATGRYITTETGQTALPSTTNLAGTAVTDGTARWVGLS